MAIVVAGGSSSPMLSLADLGAGEADGATGNRRFVCPLCDHTRHRKGTKQLSVNMATGAWRCWHCDAKGKLTDYWTDRPVLSPKAQRRERLREMFRVVSKPPPDPEPDDVEWRQRIVSAVPIAGTPGEAYLSGRGIPIALATACGVGYIRSHYGRPGVVYPLRDQAGDLAAVGVRYTDGRTDPKTRVGGRLRYGVFATPGAFDGEAWVIVEGPADALALAVCGIPAIALHQTSWPEWLVKAAAFKSVVVALDADAKGDERSPVMIAALESYGACAWRLRPNAPGCKDWNDVLLMLGADALRRRFFDAMAGHLWRFMYKLHQRNPHAALEAAIDAADWPAFNAEVRAYSTSTLPTAAPAAPAPVQMELVS